MKTEIRDGFEFISQQNPLSSALVINRSDLNSYVTYINEKAIEQVHVSKEIKLDFLLECRSIKYLDISMEHEFTPLYGMSQLKALGMRSPYGTEKMKNVIEVDRIPNLEIFASSYDRNIKGIGKAYSLKSLRLSSYSSKSKDLSEFSDLKHLDTLWLLLGGTRSLNGIEELPKIQCLDLIRIKSLSDISALHGVANSLRRLSIEDCSNAADYSVLSKLSQLLFLRLCNHASIPNLSFIESTRKLSTLICGMTIEDGDLSKCLNLDYVSIYPNKRHYSHKVDELPKRNCLMGNENIDEWRRWV